MLAHVLSQTPYSFRAGSALGYTISQTVEAIDQVRRGIAMPPLLVTRFAYAVVHDVGFPADVVT